MALKQKLIQTELVAPELPQSNEKEMFISLVENARDLLDKAVTQRSSPSKVRDLVNKAQKKFFEAIAIYSTYLASGEDEPVPKFIHSVAKLSGVASALAKVFNAYDIGNSSVSEVSMVISKSITLLDKLLEN
ncbi:hypothetical protein [Pseudanabaena sp. 'Roaring Creek']|uniref:hypothetical protein n=1 Tax=Pseudanabaena sp. 'Roaring Creek' TaxID=1681830 RepID=UPI0006D79101|nr:hypothetical protein [Pseudanabaena sp. 'Roaring Creek']